MSTETSESIDESTQKNSIVAMVDDSHEDLFIAKTCYDRSDLNRPWIEFHNGEEFLKYMYDVRDGKEPVPSLVLLDINMPEMTGFEVLEKIKRIPNFNTCPPIVMFTNSNSPKDKQYAMSLGASDFYQKPISVKQYVELFNSLKTKYAAVRAPRTGPLNCREAF